ncbi:nucleic acid binding protein [Shallot virus S]|uniref:RNA silencing suppressor n=1 Tax=Shallot virus S TaxID=2586033 RepID=A0AAE6KM75_9VIRU|nr:nucleic acid binding protein [Shallot virus S]QCY49487.1 nucleic acid binding protein [Shallot virus S]
MLIKRRTYVRLLVRVFKLHTSLDCLDVINIIVNKVCEGTPGASKYAITRRAVSVGRCARCYRCVPGFYFTKRCDQKTCKPGISYNAAVASFITDGVTK